MKTSKKYSVNVQDVAKGFLVALVTAFIASSGQWFEAWVVSPDFAIDKVSFLLSLKAGFAAGVAYLIKNFFEAEKTVVTDEPGAGA